MACNCCKKACCFADSTCSDEYPNKADCERCIPLGNCTETLSAPGPEDCPAGWDWNGVNCVREQVDIPEADCVGTWFQGSNFDGPCGTQVRGRCNQPPFPCGCCCIDLASDPDHLTPSDCASAGGVWQHLTPCYCECSPDCDDCAYTQDIGPTVVTDGDYEIPAGDFGDNRCLYGTKTEAYAFVENSAIPNPGNLVGCQAFIWCEQRSKSNWASEWDGGPINCEVSRTVTTRRVFYIDCVTKELVEVDAASVGVTPEEDVVDECDPLALSGFSACNPPTVPGAGELPSSLGGPEVICPP